MIASLLLAASLLFPLAAEGVSEFTETPSVDYSQAPEGFRVTVIGSGSPRLDITRGGQSIFVEYKDTSVLVDCGQWSTRKIVELGINIEKITNMAFTHQHADHNADFWSFAIGGWGTPTGRREMTLIGPGVAKLYDSTIDFFKEDLAYRSEIVGFPPEGMTKNVNIIEFTKDKEVIKAGDVTITAIPVPHTIDTYAYKFEADGKSIVISGDMKYVDTFGEFAKGADLIFMDGALTSSFSDLPAPVAAKVKAGLSQSHITNEDIARIAAEAQPETIVITHILANTDPEGSAALYKKAGYTGEVDVAYDGKVFVL